MNTRLRHIENWQGRAAEAKWRVAALADKCGVSIRSIERHFRKEMGKSPKTWLAEQRQERAMELLRAGYIGKEVAFSLGYTTQNHFSRDFKRKFQGVIAPKHS